MVKSGPGPLLARYRVGETSDGAELAITLERDGIFILENVISPQEVAILRDEVLALAQSKPKWLKPHPTANGFFFSLSPVVVRKHRGDEQIRRLGSVFGSELFQRICREHFGSYWYVDRIILDRKEPSPEPITDWHADQFDDQGRCVKFMLYLNDIDAGNGAFSYVPGSHRLMEALVSRHDSDSKELHLIEDIRAKAEKAIAADPALAPMVSQQLAEMEAHIASARQSDDHYTVAAPAGSVVVFDANGIHRGGVVRERERLIARSHCRRLQLRQIFASRQSIMAAVERLYLRATSHAGAESLV